MLPPMVERELRVALLRRNARRRWMVAAWSAGGICLVFLLFLGVTSPRTTGRTLFGWLFALACGGILSRGFGLTADLFSEERRNGTLGLLVLTGLRPLEIFLNKLLGAGLLAAYALLGALPFFAIPFLIGGVSPTQFLCALVFLANGLLFCVAIGLFASVLHREGGQAQITAVALSALLSLATPLARWFSAAAPSAGVLDRAWLTLSPAYPPFLVFTNFAGGSPRLFWIGSAITLCYSLTALLAAAAVLQRTWREGPETLAPQGWRERWQRWARGNELWRRRLRARLLSRHPFCWLAARDRPPALFAQAFFGLAAVFWLACWRVSGMRWLTPGSAFISSIVLHLCFNWILAYAAGRRLALERQSGGFEVLLTTPLSPAAIVNGQCKAVLVQFRTAWVIAIAFDVVLCASGFAVPGWSVPLAGVYLLAWCVLVVFWFARHLETTSRAMWISAWTARPAYAALQATRPALGILVWIWIVSWGGIRGISRTPPTVVLAFVVLLILLGVLLASFARRNVLREKLARELGLIACAPIPARGDKRFKKWDPDLIFPPGRWGELLLVPGRLPRSHRHPALARRQYPHSKARAVPR
jgi:ABC-type Na+ efflux pump permease subunit